MNEYKLGVNDGERADDCFDTSEFAGGVLGQDGLLEIHHQAWNLPSRCEGETVLGQVDLPVFAGSCVNGAKLIAMNLADILCRELMIPIKEVNPFLHCSQLFRKFRSVLLALSGYAEKIPENPVA